MHGEKILEQDRLYRGRDVMLPKYTISAGQGLDQKEAHLSMARLYFRDTAELFDSLKEPGGETYYSFADAEADYKSGPATYIGFILQQVSEQRSEKIQTVPLAGDSFHSTFFGALPVQYTFQGILFNSKNARWREAFDLLYKNYLRGYKAAGKGRPVQIIYDSKIVSGWVVNVTQNISSTNEILSQFTMTVQVIRDTPLTPVEDIISTVDDYTARYTGPKLGITDTRVNIGPDDYVRKASIALPMRAAARSTTAGRCRVKKLTKAKYNADQEIEAPSGPVSSRSPVTSTCDMAEALVHHFRVIEAANKVLEDTKNNAAKNKSKRAAAIRKRKNAKEHLRRLQGWVQRGAEGTERLKKLAATIAPVPGAGTTMGVNILIASARDGKSSELFNSNKLNSALKSVKRG